MATCRRHFLSPALPCRAAADTSLKDFIHDSMSAFLLDDEEGKCSFSLFALHSSTQCGWHPHKRLRDGFGPHILPQPTQP
mmetsp:Transcript_45515/g.113012  ORF Transcript_45515/g.113012 Transcript_45515/m.113012 type:complete len:80 (+) Transcript_45515:119-358(+)